MKRIITAAAAAAVMLTGCGAESHTKGKEVISGEFDKTANITIGGREYEARLRRGGAGMWECEFTAPECISGLTLTASPEICVISAEGLTYEADIAELPDSGLVPQVTKALDDIIAGKGTSGEGYHAETKGGEIISLQTENASLMFSTG